MDFFPDAVIALFSFTRIFQMLKESKKSFYLKCNSKMCLALSVFQKHKRYSRREKFQDIFVLLSESNHQISLNTDIYGIF